MVLERDPLDGRGRNIGLLDSLSLQRKHGLDFEVEAKLIPIACKLIRFMLKHLDVLP